MDSARSSSTDLSIDLALVSTPLHQPPSPTEPFPGLQPAVLLHLTPARQPTKASNANHSLKQQDLPPSLARPVTFLHPLTALCTRTLESASAKPQPAFSDRPADEPKAVPPHTTATLSPRLQNISAARFIYSIFTVSLARLAEPSRTRGRPIAFPFQRPLCCAQRRHRIYPHSRRRVTPGILRKLRVPTYSSVHDSDFIMDNRFTSTLFGFAAFSTLLLSIQPAGASDWTYSYCSSLNTGEQNTACKFSWS